MHCPNCNCKLSVSLSFAGDTPEPGTTLRGALAAIVEPWPMASVSLQFVRRHLAAMGVAAPMGGRGGFSNQVAIAAGATLYRRGGALWLRGVRARL